MNRKRIERHKISLGIYLAILLTISGYMIYGDIVSLGIDTAKFWGNFSMWMGMTFFISGVFFPRKKYHYTWDYDGMIKFWSIIGLSTIMGLIAWIIMGEISFGFTKIYARPRFIIGTSVIFMVLGLYSTIISRSKKGKKIYKTPSYSSIKI